MIAQAAQDVFIPGTVGVHMYRRLQADNKLKSILNVPLGSLEKAVNSIVNASLAVATDVVTYGTGVYGSTQVIEHAQEGSAGVVIAAMVTLAAAGLRVHGNRTSRKFYEGVDGLDQRTRQRFPYTVTDRS